MTFWIVVAVVVVVGFALAWVSSGRKGPGGVRDPQDPRQDEARAQSHRTSINPPGGYGGPTP